MSWNSPPSQSDEFVLQNTNPFGNVTVVDTVPKDMLHLVHAHWYQFPPMNPLWYGLVGFFMTVTGVLGLLGNLIVIWVFMNTKSLRTPANLLVVNLATSDFFQMLIMFPPMVVSCYWQTWTMGPFFCEIYAALGSLFGCTSIWTMVWITLDRYMVIVKGMAAKPLTNGGAMMRILGTWTITFLWCLPPFFGWNRYVPEGNMTACGTDYLTATSFSNSYLYIYSAWAYMTPLFLNIYLYSFIIKAVAAHEKGMREQAKKMGVKSLRSEENQKTSAECRLAKVALTTVTLWFIAWTPYFTINYSGMLKPELVTPLFSIWGSVFAKANTIYNPIIYAISHPKYKAAMEKKMPCLSCGGSDDAVSGDSGSTATAPAEKTESA